VSSANASESSDGVDVELGGFYTTLDGVANVVNVEEILRTALKIQ